MYIIMFFNIFLFFFLNDPAPPEINPLPLHDALPICRWIDEELERDRRPTRVAGPARDHGREVPAGGVAGHRDRREALREPRQRLEAELQRARERRRSEEHTSELQSRQYFVCRLLLEK